MSPEEKRDLQYRAKRAISAPVPKSVLEGSARQAAARPLSLETTGDPRSANSAAPKGCVGQGMGGTPMSTAVQPVPAENAPALCATAQGIVTRMGQDPKGLGCEAIEPGPEGMRPASTGFGACAGACGGVLFQLSLSPHQ